MEPQAPTGRPCFSSPGHRPGFHATKQNRALKGRPKTHHERRVTCMRLGRPYRALRMIGHHPGRCPGLTWTAPLGLGFNDPFAGERHACSRSHHSGRGVHLRPFTQSKETIRLQRLSLQDVAYLGVGVVTSRFCHQRIIRAPKRLQAALRELPGRICRAIFVPVTTAFFNDLSPVIARIYSISRSGVS